MTKKHNLIAGLLISGALTAFAAQPAFATVTDLTLQSFAFGYSGVTGNKPTIVDNDAFVSTSNAGNVTTVTLPYNFDFASTGSSITPAGPLFVVEPSSNGDSSATIAVTFNFLYDSQSLALVEDVGFLADPYTDKDSLIWEAGTNGTCNGSSTSSHCTYDFTIAGQAFSIMMDNETDWNMAEFDAASVNLGPTAPPGKVPEPASVAVLGAGLLGVGMLWRRRRQKVAAVSV